MYRYDWGLCVGMSPLWRYGLDRIYRHATDHDRTLTTQSDHKR